MASYMTGSEAYTREAQQSTTTEPAAWADKYRGVGLPHPSIGVHETAANIV